MRTVEESTEYLTRTGSYTQPFALCVWPCELL